MRTCSVAVRTVTTAATLNLPAACLWNPGTRSLWVTQLHWSKTIVTADEIALLRATARGTQTTSLAAVQSNAFDYQGAPFSAAAVDTAWSSIPTYDTSTNYLWRFMPSPWIGAGVIWDVPGPGVEVPAGDGLAIVTPAATALNAADCIFVWRE